MPAIYGMAALTISLTAILSISVLDRSTHSSRRFYWLILSGLPLSLVVNRLIKTPAIAWLAAWTETPLKLGLDVPWWFIAAVWLNAPIFEEAIKMLPMVLPVPRSRPRDASHALWAGFASGIGFGLGEAAFLAYGIAQSAAFNELPWYVFTGFASERLIVTFAHGLMTSIAFLGFHQGKRNALLGYLAAVGLHALINLGPILLALRLVPATVSSLGSYAAILAAFLIFQKQMRAARKKDGMATREIVYFER